MEVDESVWQFMKKHLGYNDEEMKKFRENPRNVDVLAKAPELMNKTIVVEVVQSKIATVNIKLETSSFSTASATS